MLHTSRYGVAWCYSAVRDSTVGTVVVRQPFCVMWSPPWFSSSSPNFLGCRTRVGSRPRSLFSLLACGARSHDPNRRGRGSRQSRWPLSQGSHRGSHPVVGGIVPTSRWSVFGWRAPYSSSPSGGVVLSVQHGPGWRLTRPS